MCEAPGCTNSLAGYRAHARFCSPACNASEWRNRQPMSSRERRIKHVYGLTAAQFDQLLADQGGVCAICGGLPPAVPGKIGQWNVDHDHDTGAVRGILCSPCNIGIGQLGDSIERLETALRYLRSFAEDPLQAVVDSAFQV